MANTEINSIIKQTIIFLVQELASNGTFFGSIAADTSGFGSVELLFFNTDAHVDGDYLLIPRHGDDDTVGNHVDVPADELTDPAPEIFNASANNQIFRLGYIGKKRFVSANIVATNVTSGSVIGCFLILNTPRHGAVGPSSLP